MEIIKTDRTKQELGTINEQTTFFDCGSEIHTVTVRMGETRIDMKIHKNDDGTLTTSDIDIHRLEGKCTIFTTDVEKIRKTTRRLEVDSGRKFKVVDIVVA